MTMRSWAPWALICAACATPRPADGPLTRFDYLDGTWARSEADGTREETWDLRHGWAMRGFARRIDGERTLELQQLSIEPRGRGFALRLAVHGEEPRELHLVAHGEDWARFQTAEPGYPQTVDYRRDGKHLRIRSAGLREGRAVERTLELARVR